MAGPGTPREALAWTQTALRDGRYIPSIHFGERLLERGFDMFDVLHAVEHATRVRSYDQEPEHGGTTWRIVGRNVDGNRSVAIGVECFLDRKRHRVALITVMEGSR